MAKICFRDDEQETNKIKGKKIKNKTKTMKKIYVFDQQLSKTAAA